MLDNRTASKGAYLEDGAVLQLGAVGAPAVKDVVVVPHHELRGEGGSCLVLVQQGQLLGSWPWAGPG